MATPEQILRFLHRTEYFLPFSLQEVEDEARKTREHGRGFLIRLQPRPLLPDEALPWHNPQAGLKDGRNQDCAYRYSVYLGVFALSEVDREVTRFSGQPPSEFEEEKINPKDLTCYARLAIGESGAVAVEGLTLSALPYALGCLRRQRLDEMNGSALNQVFAAASEEIQRFDRPDYRLRNADLLALVEALPGNIRWSPENGFKSLCWIVGHACPRRETSPSTMAPAPGGQTNAPPTAQPATTIPDGHEADEDEENAPEQREVVEILNSFFSGDLERILRQIEAGAPLGRGLRDFLAGEAVWKTATPRADLLSTSPANARQLAEQCCPARIPPCRWPSDDTHALSLMQQAAVNTALDVLGGKDPAGIFSVNGPPGTGKTTLLKDIVAAVLLARARALAGFSTVGEAFVGPKQVTVGKKDFEVHGLHPSIVGHEIVVASSNNVAVENVSRELPTKKALGSEYQATLQYLRSVATGVHGAESWGLISAVLGRSANRRRFAKKVFFAEKQAKGSPQNLYGGLSDSPERSFNEAREVFRSALRECENALAKARAQHDQLVHRLEADAERERLATRIAAHGRELTEARDRKQRLLDEQTELIVEQQTLERERADFARRHRWTRWLHWLGRRLRLKRSQDVMAEADALGQRTSSWQLHDAQTRARAAHEEARITNLEELVAGWEHQQKTPEPTVTLPEAAQKVYDFCRCPEQMDDARVQMTAPWLTPELNRLRAKVFVAALRLHEAWLGEAYRKNYLKGNLFALSRFLDSGGKPLADAADALTLWQTLFLVVPVVSTTFASVQRMFGQVGQEKLGWLLVDEAGQAVPQAAVGAIWRAQRTLVVGDPRQIPPVFTVSERLVSKLAEDGDAGLTDWSPHVASVQTRADAANPWGAALTGEASGDTQRIGFPLRVHRRCWDPMFTLSNQIAYDGKMIAGTEPETTGRAVEFPLGESAWLDVEGPCQGKQWVPAQGERALEAVVRLFGALRPIPKSGKLKAEWPELYLISPFRAVAQELRSHLVAESVMNDLFATAQQIGATTLPVKQWEKEWRSWVQQNVGTVHTFQGKEQSTVLLVLGASEERRAAAAWAAQAPNILNVAATRAKHRLYLVGSRPLWGGMRYFESAAELLPRITAWP